MSIMLTYSRGDLIASLEARRPHLQRIDDRNMARHQKAEQAYVSDFRKACKKAATWDYETASAAGFDPTRLMVGEKYGRYPSGPSCPRSEISRLDRKLAEVARTKQSRFKVTEKGLHAEIYQLLMGDVPKVKGLC